MKSYRHRIVLALTSFITMAFATTAVYADKKLAADKVKGDLSVMVLGSGGPVATAEGRASAGYLIFTGGTPRILMDAGGGTYQRLAKSGVNIKDLDIVLLSHLHIDHTGDLSAIIKTIYFHNNLAGTGRITPINIYGPSSTSFPDDPGGKFENGVLQYPSTVDYVDGHYSVAKGGVERYLNAFAPAISQGASEFHYNAIDLPSNWKTGVQETLFSTADGLVVKSIAVNHGPVPNVAYRIEYKGKSIVYSGDTSSKTDNMVAISDAADLLIYDTAIMDDLPDNPVFHALHTEPTRLGVVAAVAEPRMLVLSHLTPVTSSRTRQIKHIIRDQGYNGKISVARDLKVYNLGNNKNDDD